MCPKTNPTQKVPKIIRKKPGTPTGPMGLPISYNKKDYKIEKGGKVTSLKKSRGHSTRIYNPQGKKGSGGPLRYRTNKLLDAAPIE